MQVHFLAAFLVDDLPVGLAVVVFLVAAGFFAGLEAGFLLAAEDLAVVFADVFGFAELELVFFTVVLAAAGFGAGFLEAATGFDVVVLGFLEAVVVFLAALACLTAGLGVVCTGGLAGVLGTTAFTAGPASACTTRGASLAISLSTLRQFGNENSSLNLSTRLARRQFGQWAS